MNYVVGVIEDSEELQGLVKSIKDRLERKDASEEEAIRFFIPLIKKVSVGFGGEISNKDLLSAAKIYADEYEMDLIDRQEMPGHGGVKSDFLKNISRKNSDFEKNLGSKKTTAMEETKKKDLVNEDLKLSTSSKKVILSFLDKKPLHNKKLETNGETLDGLWMGGKGIARWDEDGKIKMGDLGSKSAQTVISFINRNYTDLNSENKEINEDYSYMTLAEKLHDVYDFLSSMYDRRREYVAAKDMFSELGYAVRKLKTIDNLIMNKSLAEGLKNEECSECPDKMEEAEKWIQKAVPKSHEGKFADYCGGSVSQSCIDKAKSAGGHPAKMANFAVNVSKGKYHEEKKEK